MDDPALEALRALISAAITACTDTNLLDLIYKLLIHERI